MSLPVTHEWPIITEPATPFQWPASPMEPAEPVPATEPVPAEPAPQAVP